MSAAHRDACLAERRRWQERWFGHALAALVGAAVIVFSGAAHRIAAPVAEATPCLLVGDWRPVLEGLR